MDLETCPKSFAYDSACFWQVLRNHKPEATPKADSSGEGTLHHQHSCWGVSRELKVIGDYIPTKHQKVLHLVSKGGQEDM